jgi:type IV pilus assembly protein PilQ
VNINMQNLRRYSMGKKINIRKRRFSSFLIFPAIAVMLLFGGCATQLPATSDITADNSNTSVIERNPIAQNGEISEYQTEQLSAKISDVAHEEGLEEAQFTESEPRILFEPEPTKSDLIQVLGIDFTMLEQGKSRLTITTDKKVTYDMDRKGDNDLVLRLHDTTIPSLLLREVDTTHFQTALNKVKASSSSENKEVSIALSLREMIPFHIKQAENGLSIDFDETAIKPPDMKIVPLDLAEAQTRTLSAPAEQTAGEGGIPSAAAAPGQKRYTGERMHLEFVNADVTYILQLIYEISGENIIWDPAIKGKTVSMTLKDVPWDEALDLVLDSNDLGKMYRGDNIIWISAKDKIDKFLAQEQAEAKRLQQELEDQKKRKVEEKTLALEEAPLITEYLPVDFAKADEIKSHIVLSESGKKRGANISIDTRTNTIIMTDIAQSVETAKKTIKQFDTPVKQIMIEARIVDASDNFSRDLGIKWNENTAALSNNEGNLAMPSNALDFEAGGETGFGGSFSTNTPEGWANNIGLSFARLASNGLGAITLDAALALAETKGTAKTLSAPKVIAREGSAATISSGDKIIIAATENVASTTLDATLSLTVTPTSVSYNDYITMDVEVTDDKAPSTALVTTKSISTTLMVKSGETVVIGGIIKENESDDVVGIPLLKDIPLLGWLFKANTRNKIKTELLIFLTPTVLPLKANEL